MLTIPLATLLGWLFKKYLVKVKVAINKLSTFATHLLAITALSYGIILITKEFEFDSNFADELIHLGSVYTCILGFGLIFLKNSLEERSGRLWIIESTSTVLIFVISCVVIFANANYYTNLVKSLLSKLPFLYHLLNVIDVFNWMERLIPIYITSFLMCAVIFIADVTEIKPPWTKPDVTEV